MRGIVVPQSTIPVASQERTKSTSTMNRKQPVATFQDLLSEATRLQDNKALSTAPQQPPTSKSHTVVQGDTLSEIIAAESRKLGLNHSNHALYTMVNQVAEANNLTNPNTIFPGQKIDLSSMGSQPAADEPAAGAAPEPITATENVAGLLQESTFQSPLKGKITSLFGMRNHPVFNTALHHKGIDISQPTGAPVKPLTSGIVTFSGNEGGYGQMVEINHGNGLTSRYAHLSKLMVRQGEQVGPEQTIGQVGQTGLATGPHLHLEIHSQRTPIDPLTVLNRGQIETELLFAEAGKPHRL